MLTLQNPSPEHFVRILAPALRQAASIARALEGRVENSPKAGETTPVKAALTIADSASQEALLVPLLEHFPKVRIQALVDGKLQFIEVPGPLPKGATELDPERVYLDPVRSNSRR